MTKPLKSKRVEPSECLHRPTNLRYLDKSVTMHVKHPATNSIFQAIFLCVNCGTLVVKNADIARPFKTDGSIPAETLSVIISQKEEEENRRKMLEDLKQRAEEAKEDEFRGEEVKKEEACDHPPVTDYPEKGIDPSTETSTETEKI